MKICSAVTGLERLEGACLLHTNCADIKLYFVTDEIIRVRASFDKELAEESYVLAATAWASFAPGGALPSICLASTRIRKFSASISFPSATTRSPL